jgi:hypothetical protein
MPFSTKHFENLFGARIGTLTETLTMQEYRHAGRTI